MALKLTDSLNTWCRQLLGAFQVVADNGRSHPGTRASVWRLRSSSGDYFLKLHRDITHWHNETHAYEQWASVLDTAVPNLIAVRETAPFALITTALPGQVLEQCQLSPTQEQKAWHDAGKALAVLHNQPAGSFFGPCNRDGSPADTAVTDAVRYVTAVHNQWLAQGVNGGYFTREELAVLDDVYTMLPAFAGERPFPCHRDYCPANWLINAQGEWAGVIDFEFAHWDVRAADFTRYPEWEWMHRPELVEAFVAGYGRVAPPIPSADQRLVGYAEYALTAIVWGEENAYHGFAAEGRQALRHLASWF